MHVRSDALCLGSGSFDDRRASRRKHHRTNRLSGPASPAAERWRCQMAEVLFRGTPMSSAAHSILAFGVYVVGLGAMILAAPNVLFAGRRIEKVCLLVLGTTVLIVGGYYICCARHEAVAFFRATVYGRAVVLAFFIAFVALGWARPI